MTSNISLKPDRPAGKAGDERCKFRLGDFAVDEYRPIKVVAIGAGFSGIIAGIRLVNHIVKSRSKLTLVYSGFRSESPTLISLYMKKMLV
jgi:hypothetical protein